MLLDFIFLPAIFLLGTITSWQDFRYGRIKNKWILAGSAFGTGIWIFFLEWSRLAPFFSHIYGMHLNYIPAAYVWQVFANSLVSLAIGYFFWYFDWWSAGDAKLFFVFSLLLPLKYYSRTFLPYFPSIILLVNVFSLALAYLVVASVFSAFRNGRKKKIGRKNQKGIFKSSKEYFLRNHFAFLKTVLIFFSILLIFQAISSELNLKTSADFQASGWYVLLLLLVMQSFKYAKKILQNGWLLLGVYVFSIPYLVFNNFFHSPEDISHMVSMTESSLAFTLVFGVLSVFLSRESKKEAGMSFALWLFGGVLLTMILKGSIVSFVSNWRNYWQ